MSDRPRFAPHPQGGWRWRGWGGSRLVAGITDRQVEPATLLKGFGASIIGVEAEQVHGGSVALIGRSGAVHGPVAGADALLTTTPGLALLIRTADCLPIFLADLSRGAIGIVHAGWRGVEAQLPVRAVAALRHAYHSRPADVIIAIGPAIRSCCYEVSPEFRSRFEPFLQERAGCLMCDLIGMAVEQLRGSGVRADRILDSGLCTACDPQRWYSVRREGQATGRMTSFIALQP